MTGHPLFQLLSRLNGSTFLHQTYKRAALQAKFFSKRFSSTTTSFDGSIKARWDRFKIEIPKAYEGIKRDLSDPSYVLFNVSLLIGFIGSCIPDELYLRYCAVLSSSGAIFYNTFMFHGSKFVPNLTMVAWDAFRIAAHSSNIFRIWHEKSDIGMSEAQEKMYAQHFMDFGMRPRQFIKLLHSSKGESVFGPRECLVKDGELTNPNEKKLYLLLKGTVNAEMNGMVITTITEDTPLCFFGETQLLDIAEDGIVHRKLMQSPFVDLYERTRTTALGPKTKEVVSASGTTTEITKPEVSEKTVVSESIPSNQITMVNQNTKGAAMATFVVPEGSTARVLVWDGNFVTDMIRRDDDFATQFKLVLYAAVRMKLKILAARTFEKVYEALVGGCLSDGVVNALEKQALDSFRLDHNISDQMHERIVERCGWTLREYKQGAKMDRLEGEISVGSTSNYDGLLDGIVADGIINAIERKALDMRRADHKINDKYHAQALARFGWTVEDYERGFKLPAAEVQVADNNVQSSDADKQK